MSYARLAAAVALWSIFVILGSRVIQARAGLPLARRELALNHRIQASDLVFTDRLGDGDCQSFIGAYVAKSIGWAQPVTCGMVRPVPTIQPRPGFSAAVISIQNQPALCGTLTVHALVDVWTPSGASPATTARVLALTGIGEQQKDCGVILEVSEQQTGGLLQTEKVHVTIREMR